MLVRGGMWKCCWDKGVYSDVREVQVPSRCLGLNLVARFNNMLSGDSIWNWAVVEDKRYNRPLMVLCAAFRLS